MDWDRIEDQFDVDLPQDQPILPFNVVCEIVGIQYYLLHEMIKEGIIRQMLKARNKKLLSLRDVKRIKYAKYLIEEKGVNLKGVKVIFEIEE